MPKQAMILAAGLGTRLRPLTNDKPKALVMLRGKTLLEHCVLKLSNSGISKVVINVHHFAEKMLDEIFKLKLKFPSLELIVSDERATLLETGGGLEYASKLFSQDKPVLIHNVDVISDIEFSELYGLMNELKVDAVMAVSERKSSRKLLFNKAGLLSGWQNEKSGEKIISRTDIDLKPYSFSGIHLLSFELISNLWSGKYSIIDAYLKWANESSIQSYVHSPKCWFDLGSAERLKAAEEALKTRMR